VRKEKKGEEAWKLREMRDGCDSGSVRVAWHCVKLIDCGDVDRPGYMREQELAWASGGCCARAAPFRASGAGSACWAVSLSFVFRVGCRVFSVPSAVRSSGQVYREGRRW